MDSEMIERMAAAIHDHWQATGKGSSHRTWADTCEKLPGQANDFRKKAIAVAKAMREPTLAMLVAEAKHSPDPYASWTTMIDVVIGEQS